VCARLAGAGAAHAKISAAGGVNAGNAAAYAKAERISSVTSAPYMACLRDVQVRVTVA
jgi:molybdenum transport protein